MSIERPVLRQVVRPVVRSVVRSIGLIFGAIAHFNETSIVGSAPVTAWNNLGTGGSAFDLDVVLGTGANLKLHPNASALFYGASGDFISTPDSVAASVTGSFVAGGYIQLDDNTPSSFEGIIKKSESVGNQRGFELSIVPSVAGTINLSISSLGSNAETAQSTVAVGISDGVGYWAFCIYDSSVPQVTFFTSLASPDASIAQMSSAATQLGDAVAVTFTSIFDNTASVKVGTASNGSVFRAFLISGTDATTSPVVDFNASDAGNKSGPAGDTFNTIFGSELFVNGDLSTGDTTGFTLANGAILTNVNNTLNVENGIASTGQSRQTLTTVVGVPYILTVDFTFVDANSRIVVGTSAGSDNLVNSGGKTSSQSIQVVFTATSTTSFFATRHDSGTMGVSSVWDNFSCKAGTPWTLNGNTFTQNTGQSVVNSIGSAGLETTAG